jgi:hypothetical protein
MFGDATSRDVAPGRHTLRVSNTLVWNTIAFDVKPGEQARFEAINRAGKLTYPMLVIFDAGPLTSRSAASSPRAARRSAAAARRAAPGSSRRTA